MIIIIIAVAGNFIVVEEIYAGMRGMRGSACGATISPGRRHVNIFITVAVQEVCKVCSFVVIHACSLRTEVVRSQCGTGGLLEGAGGAGPLADSQQALAGGE